MPNESVPDLIIEDQIDEELEELEQAIEAEAREIVEPSAPIFSSKIENQQSTIADKAFVQFLPALERPSDFVQTTVSFSSESDVSSLF